VRTRVLGYQKHARYLKTNEAYSSLNTFNYINVEVFLGDTKKTCRGTRIAPLILKLVTSRRSKINITPRPLYHGREAE